SDWLLAPASMPPPSGNGEPSTESSAASTLAASAFSPLVTCCWPRRIASRRSHLIVRQSEPSVPVASLDPHPKIAPWEPKPSSEVNHGTGDERRPVRIVGTRARPGGLEPVGTTYRPCPGWRQLQGQSVYLGKWFRLMAPQDPVATLEP